MIEAEPRASAAAGNIVGQNWSAHMVSPQADQGVGTRASFLRKSFRLDAVAGRGRA